MADIEKATMENKKNLLAADIGYHNVKAFYNGKGLVFSSKFKLGLENSKYDSLSIGDNTYTMGKGSFDVRNDKTKRDNVPFVLSAISKFIAEEQKDVEINLVLALPMIDHSKEESLIEAFKGKTFDYKYNDVDFKVKINDVIVGAEGYSAKYAIPHELLPKSNTYSIVDIGGGTVNIVTIIDGEVESSDTVPFGIREEIYGKILEKSKGKGKRGINSIEDIDAAFKLESLDDIKDDIEQWRKDFVVKLSKETCRFQLAKTIFFVGGGSEFLTRENKEIFKIENGFEGNVRVLDNALLANVIGLYKLGKATWKE